LTGLKKVREDQRGGEGGDENVVEFWSAKFCLFPPQKIVVRKDFFFSFKIVTKMIE
jgi:hypothetical protein